MSKDSTKAASNILLGAEWHDSIEACVRTEIRGFIEEMLETELSTALGRTRYARARAPKRLPAGASESGPEESDAVVVQRLVGHRNGHRDRELLGTFGKAKVSVPRARVETADGGTTEWTSKTLSAYRRRTKEVDALIAGSYLAGTNTRRVGRALASLFRGAVSKDTVSRVWRKIKSDWDAWNKRDLSTEDAIRLILDGTTVRVRIDRRATTISLLIVLGVRRDGQKVLLAIRSMGGESEAAWRTVLDDLAARGLKRPELAIVDGAPGLEKALTSLWTDIPIQRCTVHKLRNLIAHAPKKLAEEISSDFSDMVYAKTAKEVATRRKGFIRKWRLKCRAVADSLEEAGDKLFTFTRLPVAQWKSVRTTNAIERLHEEFKRRIKTQTVLPSAETAAMLFWGLLASGQITMRKVDGWETLAERPTELIDLAA